MLIREIVFQAHTKGVLSLDDENHLRHLLSRKYGTEDFQAFIQLQHAVITGTVKQESRENAQRVQ